MKKKITGIIICLLCAVLLCPWPINIVYKDGGTREYRALLYKIVIWNRLLENGVYHGRDIYLFPKCLQGIDRLWQEKLQKIDIDDYRNDLIIRDFRTNGSCDVSGPDATLISDTKQFEQFMAKAGEDYDFSRYEEELKRYSEAFFAKNQLVIVFIQEPSGSATHEFTEISGEESRIRLKRIMPQVGTTDMAQWHFFIELKGKVFDPEVPIEVICDIETD